MSVSTVHRWTTKGVDAYDDSCQNFRDFVWWDIADCLVTFPNLKTVRLGDQLTRRPCGMNLVADRFDLGGYLTSNSMILKLSMNPKVKKRVTYDASRPLVLSRRIGQMSVFSAK